MFRPISMIFGQTNERIFEQIHFDVHCIKSLRCLWITERFEVWCIDVSIDTYLKSTI